MAKTKSAVEAQKVYQLIQGENTLSWDDYVKDVLDTTTEPQKLEDIIRMVENKLRKNNIPMSESINSDVSSTLRKFEKQGKAVLLGDWKS